VSNLSSNQFPIPTSCSFCELLSLVSASTSLACTVTAHQPGAIYHTPKRRAKGILSSDTTLCAVVRSGVPQISEAGAHGGRNSRAGIVSGQKSLPLRRATVPLTSTNLVRPLGNTLDSTAERATGRKPAAWALHNLATFKTSVATLHYQYVTCVDKV